MLLLNNINVILGVNMNNKIKNNTRKIDNGGAVAIKGFNYQAAVIMLISLLNYKRKNFALFVETEDDVEVSVEGTHTFAQIKSLKKISIAGLIKKDKKNNTSILSKNLYPSVSNARYKIITPYFADNDMTEIILSDENVLFEDNTYCYCDNVKKKIADEIKIQDPKVSDIVHKLDNSFISITDFKDDVNAAYYYLLGRMAEKNLYIQDKAGGLALKELYFLINGVAERKIVHQSDKEKKIITAENLKDIFREVAVIEYEQALFDVLAVNGFKAIDIMRIKKEKANICHLYSEKKKIIRQLLGNYQTDDKDDASALNCLYELVQEARCKELAGLTKNAIFAILIELYADKEKEQFE